MSETIKTGNQNPENECPFDPNNYKGEQIIAPEGSFYWALIQLKLGKKVRRSDWADKEQLNFVPRRTDTEGKFDYLSHIDKSNKHGNWAPWQPMQEDLMACDWALIQEAITPEERENLVFDIKLDMFKSSLSGQGTWGYIGEKGGPLYDPSLLGSLNMIRNNTDIKTVTAFYVRDKVRYDETIKHFRFHFLPEIKHDWQYGRVIEAKTLQVTVDNVTYNLGKPTGCTFNSENGGMIMYSNEEYPAVDELIKVLQQTGKTKRFYCVWK
ncbi:DUF2829 domain-containing protein [Xenorhabdus khoisanae]|uniref:DUF2829 domain-containing protein n=1 Tax=Xenorhabdus khoisanae TaxID=880157 RepID=UPI00235A19A2|nr:DUF2829 domain-containing protein [Xenorhabdus khoisanae]MDC9614089.1 DUF2829 domain-containing protein [Xenorhabdus khoisanae]